MAYAVKEVYFTLQGEGVNAGAPSVFCRFSGCNLWNGLEPDRAGAVCKFCDTDFVGMDGAMGGRYLSAESLGYSISKVWKKSCSAPRLVVFTGGEPLLQLDQELVDCLHGLGFSVAIETNGTMLPPEGVDWICVSPKAGAPLRCTHGDELKLVFPQIGLEPDFFQNLDFSNFLLQPMSGSNLAANMVAAAEYCYVNPNWRLSLQVHKFADIP